MTRKPTPAAPPTIIATVFPVAPVHLFVSLIIVSSIQKNQMYLYYMFMNPLQIMCKFFKSTFEENN